MGSSSSEAETTTHVLLHCQNHKLSRSKLIKNVYSLDQTIALRNYDDRSIPFSIVHSNSNLI